MQFDLYSQSLLWAFGLSVIFGAIANKANFCTMGAVSDWVNIGDLSRMRAWLLAIATAIIGVGLLEYAGSIDLSLTTSNETSNPPYRSANFIWLRHLVGGLMFGVGMTLASGCGNKTLVRLGEGNMKSLVVLAIMGVAAWWMLFSNFGYLVFLQWMLPLSIDFANHGIPSQDIATVLSGIVWCRMVSFAWTGYRSAGWIATALLDTAQRGFSQQYRIDIGGPDHWPADHYRLVCHRRPERGHAVGRTRIHG